MKIISTDKVTLLGVSFDNKLVFKNHIDGLCRKASYKVHTLRCIRPSISKEKTRLLVNISINFINLYDPLYGCLLVKVQLAKSAKFISGHSKLFIVSIKIWMRSYLMSVIIFLIHQKHLCILAAEVINLW